MKERPLSTVNKKELSFISRRQKTNELLMQLKVLTPNARERWAILTTMLEMTIGKIKSGKEQPILLRPWEIDDKGHKVGSIRNAIDLLRNVSPSVVKAHDLELDSYEVFVTKEGVDYLIRELEVWREIEKMAPVDTLTKGSLEIIRKVLDELKRLLKGLIPEKT